MAKDKKTGMKAARPKSVDFDLLSEEEKKRLVDLAQKKVQEEMKEMAEDEFLQKAIAAERRRVDPHADELDETMEEITIDLPEYAAHMSINQRVFFHGFTYQVEAHVARSMRDNMARAWEHQSEIEGKRRSFYQKKKTPVIGKRAA